MSKLALVSVVIPSYNGSNYIRETVDSVLNQSYSNIEVIVLDDGSPHRMEAEVNKITDDRLTYIYKENSGVSDTRNQGLTTYANGEFIVFLDQDDVIHEHFVKNRLAAIESQSAQGACADLIKIDENSKEMKGEYRSLSSPEELFQFQANRFSCPAGYLYNRQFLLTNDIRFNRNIDSAADKFFLVQFMHKGKIAVAESSPLYYRIHSQSMSQADSPKLPGDQKKYLAALLKENLIPQQWKAAFESHIFYTIASTSFHLKRYGTSAKYVLKSFFKSPKKFTSLVLAK